MATISKGKYKWRVQLYVGGVRESATFEHRAQAEAWAIERESALKSIKRTLVAAHRAKTDKKLFMQNCDTYTEHEILQNSMSGLDTAGIYFLIRDGVIVYVGQSKNVYARIDRHKREKNFDRVAVVECKEADLTSLETLYIKKFKPILNLVGIKRTTEGDLFVAALDTLSDVQ